MVEDNVVCFPAILASGRPWARIVSCNPLELKDPALPPTFSGYAADDRAGWRSTGRSSSRPRPAPRGRSPPSASSAARRRSPSGEYIQESAWLNCTSTPPRSTTSGRSPPAPTWHRLERVRALDGRDVRPAGRARRAEGALVYLSLGSLGSADVELMRRLVEVLADAPHRVHRLEGPAARRVRACRQHVGRGVPAAYRRSCRRSTSSSRTAATTRPRSASTSASRWLRCRSSGTSMTTRSASTRPATASGCQPTTSSRRATRRDRPAPRGRRPPLAPRGRLHPRAGEPGHGEGSRPHRAPRPRRVARVARRFAVVLVR